MRRPQSEQLRLVRKQARENGMVFKEKRERYNGGLMYMFVCRASGRTIIDNCTLARGYNLYLQDEIHDLNDGGK